MFSLIQLKKQTLILILFPMLLVYSETAKGQVLTTNLDKKVLMADSLHLPANTSVLYALSILPEVLQRPGTSLLSDYDIQVDGMSLGNMSDDALSQLQLVDVEKIEVNVSPISTYQNNGQGGSINLVLRSSGHHGENLWGSVGLAGFVPLDIEPQLTIGYRTNKFMVRGLVLGDVYNYDSDVRNEISSTDGVSLTNDFTEKYRFRGQLARAYLQFMPNERNTIKWNVSHEYSRESDKYIYFDTEAQQQLETENTLRTLFNYKYALRRLTFVTELQYVYTPNHLEYSELDRYWRDSDYKTHNVSGKVEVKGSLLREDAPSSLLLTVGCNANGVFKDEDTQSIVLTYSADTASIAPDNHTRYFMPYLKLESTIGKFRLMAQGEWQNYRYHINYRDQPYTKVSNDFTGMFIGECHLTPQQNLRLILERKLNRPSENELYPYRYYSPADLKYVEGNPDLSPMLSHQISLDYLSNYRWGEHNLELNLRAGYNHVDDIIQSYMTGGNSGTGGFIGYSMPLLNYHNVDRAHIFFADLMAFYSYRFFNVSLTSEVYNNSLTHEGASDHYTYFNMSLRPSLQFNNGWATSLRVSYFSKVDQNAATLGSHAFGVLSVGKRWHLGGRHSLYAYLYGRLSLTGKTKDTVDRGTAREVTTYHLTKNTIGLGIKYNF